MSAAAYQNPPQEEIFDLLRNAKRIAVVGMSSKPERASYGVSKLLIERGYEVIPVNPTESEILGQKSYGSLGEIEGKIDIVDVFRRSDATDPIIDEAIEIGAGAIWLQEGVVNDAGADRARAKGLKFVQDRCVAKELRKM